MNPSNVVVRFDKVAEQATGPVLRIVGLARARDILQLFDAADLEANPRSAKAGAVTEDIIESIQDTAEIFAFKTKGVLVGASSYQRLQRNRYELEFVNPKIEGILDGGHNMLAIGTFILMNAVGDTAIRKRIKRWPDFKELWEIHRPEIEKLRKDHEGDGASKLDFLVPLEILVPADLDDQDIIDQFNSSLLSICSARNNNVELTLETKANKKGYYEDLRSSLPVSMSSRVEWKTNDGGDIKVRDLIALSWVPLSVLQEEFVPKLAPQNIYRNKGECAKLFDELMGSDLVSMPTDGEYTRELHNEKVRSALKIAGELPALYDKIYMDFPYAYNNDGDGKFGRISVVKMAKDMRSKPTSYFTNQDVEYSYPDGLIMPIVYGLKSLMQVDDKGRISWKLDPYQFLDETLPSIARKYRVILEAFRFDPQKVGKNEGSYTFVLDAFETELMRRNQSSLV